MANDMKQHWVFRAHVMNRAGALTSIASAFSNEGISIDTVVGHGTEEHAGVDGSVVLTFFCSVGHVVVPLVISRVSLCVLAGQAPTGSCRFFRSRYLNSRPDIG